MSENYDDLIEENIDDLNSSSDFAGTEVRDKEEVKLKSKSFFTSFWFGLGAVCLLANVIIYFYYQNTSSSNYMTMEEANAQVEEVFGAALEQLDSLLDD